MRFDTHEVRRGGSSLQRMRRRQHRIDVLEHIGPGMRRDIRRELECLCERPMLPRARTCSRTRYDGQVKASRVGLAATLALVSLGGCGRVSFDAYSAPYCSGPRSANLPYANSGEVDGSTDATAFEICTAQQLDQIGRNPGDWSSYFKLVDDLDLAELGDEVTAIGDPAAPFSGSFDGQDHVVRNLVIDRPSFDNVALFAMAGQGARIANVSLLDFRVSGKDSVGALVGASTMMLTIENITLAGSAHGSNGVGGALGSGECISPCNRIAIRDVTAIVDVEATRASAGAIVGYAYRIELQRVGSSGAIAGGRGVGGLVGWGDSILLDAASSSATITAVGDAGGLVGGTAYHDTLISSSFATGHVTCTAGTCGGIVGYNEGDLFRSYATGDVTCGDRYCGGLAADFDDTVVECYATGKVTGRDYVGSLIGVAEGSVRDSYATGDASGDNFVGGLVGSISSGDSIASSYAVGAVRGTDYVGGLLGGTWVNSVAITTSFATGPVSGNNSSNRVSRLFGGAQGPITITDAFFDAASMCTNLPGSCTQQGTGIDLVSNPGYFFLNASAPLSSWDFATVWEAVPDRYPDLRSL